jgi:putative membrane protein
MSVAPAVAALIVAALHLGFFALESVLWTQPRVRRIFGLSADDAERTKQLASNQGVYNAMVAAGLVWGVWAGQVPTVGFLLVFVAVVGIYGAVSVKPTIFVVQALPAIVALALLAWA